jgi:hypothetical protein
MTLCAGFFALAPAVTLANYLRETAFAWYWGSAQPARGSRRCFAGGGVMKVTL